VTGHLPKPRVPPNPTGEIRSGRAGTARRRRRPGQALGKTGCILEAMVVRENAVRTRVFSEQRSQLI